MLKALIVVDLQREFIINDKTEKAYNKVLSFVKATTDYDLVIATQFVRGNPLYMKLLNFYFPENPTLLEFEYDKLIKKTGYGLPVNEYFNLSPAYHYDIVGCETDACVLKIATDLFDREYSFNILYPYVFTGSDVNEEELKKLLKHKFGTAVKY